MGYLVIAWPEEHAAPPRLDAWGRALEAAEWRLVHAAARLRVWTRGGLDLTAPSPDLLLLGELRLRGADLRACPSGSEASARWLLANAWGRYVAVLGGGEAVLRSPAGAPDALTWRMGQAVLVASGLEHLPGAVLPELSVDWDALAAQVRVWTAAAHQPALSGLRAIAAGDLQPLHGGPARALWRPADFARRRDVGGDAAATLRAAVFEAIVGLVEGKGRLLVEISGGLDSAVTAGVLGAAGLADRAVLALNYHGDRLEGDERSWAGAVAERVGLPLVTAPKRPGRVTPEDWAELARGARPPLHALDPERDRDTAERCAALGVEAILTGQGGDVAFFQFPTPDLLADLARLEGPGAWLGPYARALARRLQRSVWSVAWTGWRAARRPWRPAFGASDFWGPRIRALPPDPPHPWAADLGDLPPAKRSQVEGFAGLQIVHGPTRRGAAADLLHPLLSQPVMEAALAIPAPRLAEGGAERGLARRAFADLTPEAVRRRASKGALNSLYGRRVAASLDVLRPLLLDGRLAAEGVLDRAALEVALDPDRLIWRPDGALILSAAALEVWAQAWSARAARFRSGAAAA